MTPEAWTAIGIFLTGQLIVWIVTLTSVRSDNRNFRGELSEMKDNMKEIAKVVTVQAVQTQIISSQDQKIVSLNNRQQELENRLNRFVDSKILAEG